VLASMLAYWAGDFSNSYVLAKMKLWTRGQFLWTRTIGRVVVFNCLFKVSAEVVFTPLTYLIVNWLKRVEREGYHDYHTDFTPFSLQD
jgi:uncharacterized PurR-regulated membrane protein YhhQ (DUF165 family)